MGHATRCVPIINTFLEQSFTVYLAGETAVSTLLQKEYPQLIILPLRGYRVQYSKKQNFFALSMLFQIPQILHAIFNENRWLKKIIEQYKIDVVLSDNRYGLYHKAVPTIFLTHQLQIKTGTIFFDKVVQKINYYFIKKFTFCWVIDLMGEQNLAGQLSHPKKLPAIPVIYISALSRFHTMHAQQIVDVLIVLSGPEPQRTIFEKIILTQVQHINKTIILVRGLPVEKATIPSPSNNVKIINHLTAAKLNELVVAAKVIVSRSGYTSIMDYAALQKKVIYIPTPGQTEQIYLANYLSKKNYAQVATQAKFNLQGELQKLDIGTFLPYPAIYNEVLKKAITSLK